MRSHSGGRKCDEGVVERWLHDGQSVMNQGFRLKMMMMMMLGIYSQDSSTRHCDEGTDGIMKDSRQS